MKTKRLRSLLVAAAFVTCFGCGGEGQKAASAVKPGTIAHAWATARDSYTRGDYLRSMEQLTRVSSSQNEFRDKARLQLLLIASGVADGYIELASAYEEAAKFAKGPAAADYRKKMGEARNVANRASMEFAESFNQYLKANKDPKPAFDFPFPTGSTSEPLQLLKVKKGLQLQEADYDVLKRDIAQRGVVRFASAIAGSPEDPEKAKAAFTNPPRDAFLLAMTEGLYKKADLYCQRKLDMPQRGNVLCQKALETVAMLPDSKERKQLEAKIKEELKRHKVQSS